MNIGIAGVGLVGRVLALNLLQRGHTVTLFDEDTAYGDKAAGITAAGMLAVFAELESAESVIFDHGKEASKIELLDRAALKELEPDLDQHAKAFFIPHEGQVDAQRFMKASSNYLLAHPDVTWNEETKVTHVLDGTIRVGDEIKTFDWVFDARGVGAQGEMDDLRGVRGEVFWLDAPEVNITRPTRMLHPRYKIYIVPRPNNRYVIGATEIETEDKSPMSVRSSLELLSAVYSMHSGFAEARIVNMLTNCRPSLRDNLPRIEHSNKMTRINGLYRHGYLLAPAVVEEALKEGVNA